MTIRWTKDDSLVAIWVCRHANPPTAAFESSRGLCQEHNGIPDCLMRFTALRWLTHTASNSRRGVWRSKSRSMSAEDRDVAEPFVKACRFSGRIGDTCAEHDSACIDTYVAATFIGTFARNRHLWAGVRDDARSGNHPFGLQAIGVS